MPETFKKLLKNYPWNKVMELHMWLDNDAKDYENIVREIVNVLCDGQEARPART
jgi:hypothetical protein